MKISPLAPVLATLAALGALAGCSSSEPRSSEGKVEVVRSAQQRNTSPTLSATELTTLSKGEADFAVDIFHAVEKDKGDQDVFLSPHSISIALAMTYAGARGTTAAEMKSALHFDLPDDRVHVGFDYLDLALGSRGKNASGKDDKPFRLNIANSIWGQKGSSFEPAFLDTIAVNYGAGLNVVDFIGATEQSRLSINGWVEEKTENRIKDLIPQGRIGADTRMVLVNAVYFNAAWKNKFTPGATQSEAFTKVDGSSTQVSMMHSDGFLPYGKGDGYEAVELPYDGNELSMLVIAPTKGTFKTFETSLTGGKVLDILAGLSSKEVNLGFPKIKLEADFGLKPALVSLGMKAAFEDSADFSGLSTKEAISIADVLHKTFLEIDENGTEAAAATAVIGKTSSAAIDPPIQLTVDRPFITAIVDRETKALVFLGRIMEPKL